MGDSDGESCDGSSSGEEQSAPLFVVLEDDLPSQSPHLLLPPAADLGEGITFSIRNN